jgi:hypothetical protein
MTQPEDGGRKTQVVDVKGRPVVIRALTDLQMMHLLRHSKILQKEDIGLDAKADSAVRIFDIVQSTIVQPSDREYVTELEETGEITLTDLVAFIQAFQDEEAPKPAARARRGRTPAKR